jgi:hypothetical protein
MTQILLALLMFGLPAAIIAAISGALLPRFIAIVLSILVAAITPIVASVLSWPPDPRNRESIFTMAWFTGEPAGFLAIPWVLCLISAAIGFAVGRRFYRRKTSNQPLRPL